MLRSFEKAARNTGMIAVVPTQAEEPKGKRCTEEMCLEICEKLIRQHNAFKNGMDYRED